MEVKSGYKQTEIGVLPDDWDVMPLGRLFQFKNGLNKAKEYFGHGTPIVNYMDVFQNQCLRLDDIRGRVDVDQSERRAYEVRQGDVFFTRTSETTDEIGVAAVMLDAVEDTVYSGFVLRARPVDDTLDDGFKGYCFATRYFRQQVISRASYTTRALTNGRSLSAALLATPPLAEQRAIAAALIDVDALLDGLERLISKKRDLKQAAMQQLLTGKTRLPGFSGEWEVRRFGDHVTFLRNGVNSRAELLAEGRVRYLHYGDVHAAGDSFMTPNLLPCLPEAKAARLARLQDGDLVIADASEDVAGVSKSVEMKGVGSAEVVAGLHTIAARFDKSVLANGFKGFLQFCPAFAAHLRRLAAGTKVYATTRAHVASVEMRLPSVSEQVAIAEVLTDIDAEIAALEARRDKTRALKQGMMQELLRGRARLVPLRGNHG